MRNLSKRLGGVPWTMFLAVCFVLVLQATAARVLSIPERVLPIPQLHSIPMELGPWKAWGEGAMEDAVTAYLKPDEYILRDYANEAGGSSINIFVAYFRSLQNSYGPHSPRICLPGSGWLVRSAKITSIRVSDHRQEIPINEYVLEKSSDHILVWYWYQNDRHIWAEEFKAKLTLLPDLIRYRRSDVSLVRLVTRMQAPTPGKEAADCLAFTNLVFPVLKQHFESVN